MLHAPCLLGLGIPPLFSLHRHFYPFSSSVMPESSKKTAKVEAAAVVPTPTKALKKGTREAEESIKKSVVAAAKKKEETSSDDYENSDEEDAAPSKTPVTKKKDATSEESESEEESDGDQPQNKKTKSQAAAALFPDSTTLFVANIPTSARQVDLEDFFKPAGKVVNYKFCKSSSESYCYAFVALDTSEAAKKALLELNGLELLGSELRFDMDSFDEEDHIRSEDLHMHDPLWGLSRDSYSRERLSGSVAIFSGFSIHDGEAKIKSYVANIFKNSSAPPKVSIPKEKDGRLMWFVYLDFPDEDALIEALKQPRCKVGESTYWIDGPVLYQQEN